MKLKIRRVDENQPTPLWLRKPKKLLKRVAFDNKQKSIVIRPQEGPQEQFLNCPADVAFYGGAAGGGKSWALAYDQGINAMRYSGFAGAVFRRSLPMITNPGGFLAETESLFPKMGGVLNRSLLEWRWPNGSVVKLSQLQHEDTVNDWQSAQLGVIAFDELTQFSKRQFFYMLSRLRSMCGIRPYVRGGLNPDPESWLKEFIAWWLDEDGYPIIARAGIIRWFAVDAGAEIWADTAEELHAQGYENPLSFTFIPAKLDDNKILIKADPTYKSKLDALNPYDRAMLRDGNWNTSKSQGMLFDISKIRIVDALPAAPENAIRYWDRAATEKTVAAPDPDWTAGVHMIKHGGIFYITDVSRFRARPFEVKSRIKLTSELDGMGTEVGLEQDPGSAGVSEIDDLRRDLSGKALFINKVTAAKFVRAKPYASQVEAGNVCLLRGAWNSAYLRELDLFIDEGQMKASDGYHDDQVDGSSGAFNRLNETAIPRVR